MKTMNEYLGTPQSHTVADVLEPILISFSCDESKLIGMSLVESDSKAELSNFSQGTKSFTTEDIAEAVNFSLQMYLREKKQNPREVLRRRIQYLTNYLKSKSVENLIQDRDYLLEYIREPLLYNIVRYMKGLMKDPKAMTEGEDSSGGQAGGANLMIALGIAQYITDKKKVMDLQNALRRLAPQLAKDGYLRRDLQIKVTQAYAPLFSDMIQTIEKKYVPEEKWGILQPNTKKDQ